LHFGGDDHDLIFEIHASSLVTVYISTTKIQMTKMSVDSLLTNIFIVVA